MAEQRGHLASTGQPGSGLQPLLLLARQVFSAALDRQVEHGAHPTFVSAIAVDQRCLVNHHRKALTVAAQEDRLISFMRRLGRDAGRLTRGLAALVLDRLLGRPIGRRAGALQFLGRVADHVAEGRVHIDDAAIVIARSQAREQRILHRFAEHQGLGQQALGPGTTAPVTRQQQDHDEQTDRQAQHQRGGQVRNQAGRTLHRVDPQLQCDARQVDDPVGDEHAAASNRAAAGQPCAVSLDDRQLMTESQLDHPQFVEQQRQNDAHDREAHQLSGLLHRHAQVQHFDAQTVRQGHELAVREHRRHRAPRYAASQRDFGVHLGAWPAQEQRLAKRRLGGLEDLQAGIAALDPADLTQLGQQGFGIALPSMRLARALLQTLQTLQHHLAAAPDLAQGGSGDLVAALLGSGLFIAQGQRHQQGLRHQQQHHQCPPQQRARPAPTRADPAQQRGQRPLGQGRRQGR